MYTGHEYNPLSQDDYCLLENFGRLQVDKDSILGTADSGIGSTASGSVFSSGSQFSEVSFVGV